MASSASDGRLRCTGPGRPLAAMRIARATSCASSDADLTAHDAFASGAARSTWRISWNAPRPISSSGECPLSSTTGDSEASAV